MARTTDGEPEAQPELSPRISTADGEPKSPQGPPPTIGTRSASKRLSALLARRSFMRFVSVAAVGYVIVAVFGLAFLVARTARPGDSVNTGVVVAALVAGPLVVASLWNRLRAFKAFGIEVTLLSPEDEVSVESSINVALSESQYFSDLPHLVEKIAAVTSQPALRLLEVNLRSTTYWWSTRLYLQAALCDDESQIEAIVFVEGDDVRRYWGMATPKVVRNTLASRYPYLETIYAKSRVVAAEKVSDRAGDPEGFVAAVVKSWFSNGHFGEFGGEQVAKDLVTSREVVQWRITEPLLDSVEWEGAEDTPLLSYLILERGRRFVALLRQGRLAKVADADAMARRLALSALRA